MVLATQNPIEYEGTYPLPEAQLDRFMMRLTSATRSSRDEARDARRARRRAPLDELARSRREEIRAAIAAAERAARRGEPNRYVVALLRHTRADAASCSAAARAAASP